MLLVLCDHADGAPTDVSLQALTLARGLAQGGADRRAARRARGPRGGRRPGRARRRHGARGRARRARRLRARRVGPHRLRYGRAPRRRRRRRARERARQRGAGARRRARGRADGRQLHRREPRAAARADAHPLGRQPARGGAPARRARVPHGRAACARDRGRRRRRRRRSSRSPRSSARPTSSCACASASAAAAGGVSLADAKVVVTGGRGVGSPEGFAPIEELAAALGGAVGCSRAVTMAGWRSHTDQVGQTGTKIAPEIYIACGVSGATAAPRRRQGREAHPRGQHRPGGADHGERRLRRDRRPARGRAGDHRRDQAPARAHSDRAASSCWPSRSSARASSHGGPACSTGSCAWASRWRASTTCRSACATRPSSCSGRRSCSSGSLPGAHARRHLLGLHRAPADDRDGDDRHRRPRLDAAVARLAGLVRVPRRPLRRARARGRPDGVRDPQDPAAQALRRQPPGRGRSDPRR